MNCEDFSMLLDDSRADPERQRRVIEHLAVCEDCRLAQLALDALRAARTAAIPQPPHRAFERALLAAAAGESPQRSLPAGFWAGLVAGAAAAGIVVAAWLTLAQAPGTRDALNPGVTIALHRAERLSIAIESPQALNAVEIHVSLRGAVDLEGYEGQRDLRWTTDLAAGNNELSLPVVATGRAGGQVIVEVRHGRKQKTFLVDVYAAGSENTA